MPDGYKSGYHETLGAGRVNFPLHRGDTSTLLYGVGRETHTAVSPRRVGVEPLRGEFAVLGGVPHPSRTEEDYIAPP